MTKQYAYIGSQEIIDNLPNQSARIEVSTASNVIDWIQSTHQKSEYNDSAYTATFIIDTENKLWINDRRSEHVLCAKGENVLSAGEITFEVDNDKVEIIAITNQSTGYCPEPQSWINVEIALANTDMIYPDSFTDEYIFRLCDACGQKNIVKDNWYFCAVCDSPLSKEWNFI